MFSQLLDDAAACAEIQRLIRPFDLLRMTKLPDGRLPVENLLATSRRVSMDTNAYATVLVAPFEQWRASAIDRSYQKELAKKYLSTENVAIVVVGEAKEIKPELEKLGKVFVYDQQLKPVTQ